jgi:hypothetical protein
VLGQVLGSRQHAPPCCYCAAHSSEGSQAPTYDPPCPCPQVPYGLQQGRQGSMDTRLPRLSSGSAAAAAAAGGGSGPQQQVVDENTCAACQGVYGDDDEKDVAWLACDVCNRWGWQLAAVGMEEACCMLHA